MKSLIKWSGIATALGINGWLVWDNFITVNQSPTLKLTFGGMLAGLVGVLVGFGKLNAHIGRKLQAIETAREMNVVGKTSAWYATTLQYAGVVLPMGLIGGLFYYVENYFAGAGTTILQMTAALAIPMTTNIIYKVMERNEIVKKSIDKEKALYKGVADEIESRRVVEYL